MRELVLELGHLLLERRNLRLFPDHANVPLDDALVDGLIVLGARRRIAALVARGRRIYS